MLRVFPMKNTNVFEVVPTTEFFRRPTHLSKLPHYSRRTATMALPTSRGLFRSLLRARSVAFKGDPTALSAARVEIRKHFDVRPPTDRRLPSARCTHVDRRRSRSPPPPSRLPQESKHLGPEEALEKIKEGVEAESFIRLHVVQAVGNERGNYEMRIEPQHVDGEYEAPGRAGGCAGEDGEKKP